MNQPKFNRRNWIKTGSLLAGSLALGNFPATAIPRKSIRNNPLIREYAAPDRPELKARLLANENPFGPSEKAKEVLRKSIDNSFRYPYWEIFEFMEMIAEKEGVKPENILLGAGSTEILLAAASAYGMGQTKILTSDITYMDLLKMAEDHGAEIDAVPLTKDLDYDLDAMQKKAGKEHSLVYVVNPNNPTGKSLDPVKLKSFCKNISSKTPIFVDEAYIDFKDDVDANSMISCVKKGQNVIVARTFSKLHAFAGLRFGYAIALPETIEKISKFTTGGRNISYPTMYAARASYQDYDFLKYSKEQIIKSKNSLYKTLEDAGYTYVKSDANFVLFPLKYMKAERFVEEMMKEGVGVRSWSFRDKEWCRISMGNPEEMKLFAKAFEKFS